MKDVEATLLAIPGVTEAQAFAKLLVRCEFPMSSETMMELQCAQAQIEYETGWKVEMTISAGRAATADELAEPWVYKVWEKTSDEALASFGHGMQRPVRP